MCFGCSKEPSHLVRTTNVLVRNEKNNFQLQTRIWSHGYNVNCICCGCIRHSVSNTYRGSYMGAHVLLNLLNKLGKRDKFDSCQAFYLFFATSLINSIIQEHEFLSYDIKITLKSHFCRKNVMILSICKQRCY